MVLKVTRDVMAGCGVLDGVGWRGSGAGTGTGEKEDENEPFPVGHHASWLRL